MKRLMQLVFASTGIVLLALTLILTDTNQVIGQPSQSQLVEVVNGTEMELTSATLILAIFDGNDNLVASNWMNLYPET